MNLVLEKIKKKALEEHVPIIMDDTLEVVINIIKDKDPERILEIGTAVGYSAICFINNCGENTKIDTIEKDEEKIKEAKKNIMDMNLENRINIIEGDAVNILPELKDNSYDIIFIDAAKGKYPFFLEQSIRLAKNNAIILADNILYKGYVLSDYNKHKQRTAVNHLREYIEKSKNNSNLDTEILSVGDGLAISKVTKNRTD